MAVRIVYERLAETEPLSPIRHARHRHLPEAKGAASKWQQAQ